MRDVSAMRADLLSWYDANARELPWRVGPRERQNGVLPDPYEVWLSEIMLQQTTVAAVRDYFRRFTAYWPNVRALAAADDADVLGAWAGLGYYARARNLIACARAVAELPDARFPDTETALQALPGIGPYTSAAIAAIAFDRQATVVDGNVERVMARLHAEATPLPGAKRALRAHAARFTPGPRPGDLAQAMMDLGATICTPRAPACGRCPLKDDCAGRNRAEEFPVRAAKVAKPVRHGKTWIARRDDGAWLLETRPRSGLLGGMQAWPGSDWDGTVAGPPITADWKAAHEHVRHTFTHFHLVLEVRVALVDANSQPDRGRFVTAAEFDPTRLPSLMQKAWRLADSALRRAGGFD